MSTPPQPSLPDIESQTFSSLQSLSYGTSFCTKRRVITISAVLISICLLFLSLTVYFTTHDCVKVESAVSNTAENRAWYAAKLLRLTTRRESLQNGIGNMLLKMMDSDDKVNMALLTTEQRAEVATIVKSFGTQTANTMIDQMMPVYTSTFTAEELHLMLRVTESRGFQIRQSHQAEVSEKYTSALQSVLTEDSEIFKRFQAKLETLAAKFHRAQVKRSMQRHQ
jgi:uncharacterized coiled-coil protein SlyX